MKVAFDVIDAGSNPPFAKPALFPFPPITNQIRKPFIFNKNKENI